MRIFNPAIAGALLFAVLGVPSSAQGGRTYDIYFGFQSANLTADADAVAATVEQEAVAAHATQIDIVGHTDTPEAHGQALSLARAKAVEVALLSHGLPESVKVSVRGDGATHPAQPTGPGTREPLNCFVAVTVH